MANKRKNIALFMAMLENEFSRAVLDGAVRAAEEADVNLFIFPMGLIGGAYSDKVKNSFRYQYNILSSFLQSKSLDGAIIEYGTIVSTLTEEDKKDFLAMTEGMKTILLSESAEGFPSVCANNKTGLKDLIRHLIKDHGYKKIGFVSGPESNHDAIERLGVFLDTVKSEGLDIDEDWVEYGNFSIYSGDVVQRLITRHPDIEAICFANDHMALGAYNRIKKLGRTLGKDIFVTGFDDVPSAALAEPELSTVKADIDMLSYHALRALVGLEPLEENMIVDTRMILRNSCGCADSESSSNNDSKELLKQEVRALMVENEKQHDFENEIGNVLREMVFYQDSELEWYDSVMNILDNLDFLSAYMFLYKEPIYHRNGVNWVAPEIVDLRACYVKSLDKTKKVFDKDEVELELASIFNDKNIQNAERMNYLVTPLFFRENHYGILAVSGDHRYFQFAFQIAAQVSSTLESMRIIEEQNQLKKNLYATIEDMSKKIAVIKAKGYVNEESDDEQEGTVKQASTNDNINYNEDEVDEDTNKELILLVDNNAVSLKMANKIFVDSFDTKCFQKGLEALAWLKETKRKPDVIIIDAFMDEYTGIEFIDAVKLEPDICHIPIILAASDNSRNTEIKCLEGGATDFFIKPLIPDVTIRRVRRILDLIHLQQHLEEEVAIQTAVSEERAEKVERLSLQSMTAMAAAIDAKDRYTNGHSTRVAYYSKLIAGRAGKTEREQNDIYYIGLLHDVGKIGIPDEIINKAGKLTDEEYNKIKEHPAIGSEILKKISEIPNIAVGARWHHERFDGRGYPDGLAGLDVPEIARIIAVADSYDAMTSNRSYRKYMDQEKVREEIEKGRGTQFDPKFADLMIEIIDEDTEYKMHE